MGRLKKTHLSAGSCFVIGVFRVTAIHDFDLIIEIRAANKNGTIPHYLIRHNADYTKRRFLPI